MGLLSSLTACLPTLVLVHPPCGPSSSRVALRPSIWHVVWNESSEWSTFNTSNKGFFAVNKDPRLYRAMQTTVADFSFTTSADVSPPISCQLYAPKQLKATTNMNCHRFKWNKSWCMRRWSQRIIVEKDIRNRLWCANQQTLDEWRLVSLATCWSTCKRCRFPGLVDLTVTLPPILSVSSTRN